MFSNKTIKYVFAVLCMVVLFSCVAPVLAGGPVVRKFQSWFTCPRKVGIVTSANSYPVYQTGWVMEKDGRTYCEKGKPNAWESAKDSAVRARYAAQSTLNQWCNDINNAYQQGNRLNDNAQCVVRNQFGQCIR